MKIVSHSTIVKGCDLAQHWAVGMETSSPDLYDWIEITSTPDPLHAPCKTEVTFDPSPSAESNSNSDKRVTVKGVGNTNKTKEQMIKWSKLYVREHSVYRGVGEAGDIGNLGITTEGKNCQDFSYHFFKHAGCEHKLKSRQDFNDLQAYVKDNVAANLLKFGANAGKETEKFFKKFGF